MQRVYNAFFTPLNNKEWSIRHVSTCVDEPRVLPKPEGTPIALGTCDSTNQIIDINVDDIRNSGCRSLFEVELHEALHAIFPDMSENKIERSAQELELYLKRLGYNKELEFK